MIHFLTTGQHRYTFDDVARALPQIRVHAYEEILKGGRMQPGTYVFCDIDRLSFQQQANAAKLYRDLRSEKFGCRTLNNPARVRTRHALLKTLFRLGHNSFTAYRAEDHPTPRRFPVFVRYERGHGDPVSGLIETQTELEETLQRLIQEGALETALLVIEYCAEPVEPGVFRKLAAYRLGDRIVPANTVHDDQWCVKYGKTGGGTDELYADELQLIETNRYESVLRPVFEAAHIEYGRVDFGIVSGKIEVYEINTNPRITAPSEHPSPVRVRSQELAWKMLLEAIAAIDDSSGPGNQR